MSEETDADAEKFPDEACNDNSSEKNIQNETSTDDKHSDNSEMLAEEKLESPESKLDDDIDDPPTVQDDEDRWCDNYQFVDDEKPTISDNEQDPVKLVLWAAQKNELETLRTLLEGDPSLVHAKDNDLYTPLHRACYNNNVEVIRILLSYDADIQARTADGWEPLHCACKWDSVEAVSLLIQNGADVNAQTNGHITPLHLAASNVSGRRTLELLLWHPYIDPNIINDAGDTAYDIARRSGPLGALFEILEESVNVY